MKQFLLLLVISTVCLFCSCSDSQPKQVLHRGNLQMGEYYLFCHMSGRGEWTAYALSEDGENFEYVLNGDSVFSPANVALIEGGTRDAFVCRRPNNDGFLMTTTDMNVRQSRVWNNYGIDLLTSSDLISWNSVTLDFRKGPELFIDSEASSVYKDWSTICRVWAPQAIWDKEKNAFMVYFSMLNLPEENYDRVYYCYADSSFTKLTQPQLLFDWGYAASDPDIQYNQNDGMYHMLVKRDGKRPGIVHSTSERLTGPWREPNADEGITFDGRNTHTEGVASYQLAGDSTWRVCYVEHFGGKSTLYMGSADVYLQNLTNVSQASGVADAMQGSFLRITREEYERIKLMKR